MISSNHLTPAWDGMLMYMLIRYEWVLEVNVYLKIHIFLDNTTPDLDMLSKHNSYIISYI